MDTSWDASSMVTLVDIDCVSGAIDIVWSVDILCASPWAVAKAGVVEWLLVEEFTMAVGIGVDECIGVVFECIDCPDGVVFEE